MKRSLKVSISANGEEIHVVKQFVIEKKSRVEIRLEALKRGFGSWSLRCWNSVGRRNTLSVVENGLEWVQPLGFVREVMS